MESPLAASRIAPAESSWSSEGLQRMQLYQLRFGWTLADSVMAPRAEVDGKLSPLSRYHVVIDREVVADASRQHEHVPDGMTKRQPPPRIESDAGDVGGAAH